VLAKLRALPAHRKPVGLWLSCGSGSGFA
jgi:hypothetical protein